MFVKFMPRDSYLKQAGTAEPTQRIPVLHKNAWPIPQNAGACGNLEVALRCSAQGKSVIGLYGRAMALTPPALRSNLDSLPVICAPRNRGSHSLGRRLALPIGAMIYRVAQHGKRKIDNQYSREAKEKPDPCTWLREQFESATDPAERRKIAAAPKALGCRNEKKRQQ